MNNKGQFFLMSIVIAIMIFMAGMLFANFLKDDVTTARTAAALDCNNSTISDGSKVVCLGVDLVIPYWIILVVSASGGVILSRLLL